MVINKSNFREKTFEDSLNNIKDIFNNKNIKVKEYWVNNSNIYSVHIKIENTNITSNGKGIDKTSALVSAYAEMCERLQTKLQFRLNDVISINEIINTGSTIAKNKIDLDFELWVHKLNMNILDKENVIKLYYDKQDRLGEILKYQNFNKYGEFINLPTRIVDYYYGSNGMSAGNTINEAIAHAFVEIAERYTMQCILKNNHNYIFEDISDVVKNKYESINQKVSYIESFELKCRILDLSCVAGVPTIGLLSYRKKNSEYFFNIGSSTSISIAVERAITEFLQGRNLSDINDMSKFRDMGIRDRHYSNKNIVSIFRRNVGDYPISIIYNQKIVSELNPIWSNNVVDIDSMIEFYKQIFLKLNHKDIYIKDFTCIGFPTVQVVIPGISEIGNINDSLDLIKTLDRAEAVEKYLELIKKDIVNYEIVEYLIAFFESFDAKNGILFLDIFRIPIKPDDINMLDLVTSDYILSILNIMRNDTVSADKYLNKYLDFLNDKMMDSTEEIILYFEYLIMIIKLHNAKVNKDKIYDIILGISYSTKIAKICFNDFYNNNISSLLPQIICPKCEFCEYIYCCAYNNEKDIFNRFKKI